MSKIKILDKTITNRISAGEVVEKPASVVKELLENSIDAGASRISIEIENGGTSKIAITDNGSGIEKDDMTLTITPHATSKISSVEDLNGIETLGFRGEALASIACVSKLEIISKTQNAETGSKLSSEGGEIISQTEIACQQGTYISVDSLFYNTPVRAKFLRKPKSEETDITDYVERIMLAFPNLAIKYVVDGKIKYNTNGGGLFDNIYTIYGKEVSDSIVKVDYKNKDYEIVGYIGRPEIAKPNRNYQSLFVSNRYVKNFMISSAIQNAFEHYLMKNKYPFYVLNLILPFDNVDVNVHPNKLEVKFEKPNEIFSAFYSCANECLESMDETKKINLVNEQNFQNLNENTSPIPEMPENQGVSFGETKKQEITEQSDIFSAIKSDLNDQKVENQNLTFRKTSIVDRVTPIEVTVSASNEQTHQAKPQMEEIKEEKSVFDVVDYKIIGTLFSTYNIIESGDFVYFIDQHAAHERILYDKFMKELKEQNITTQELLMPFVIKVKDIESEFLSSYLPLLSEIGFVCDNFGHNTFKVRSVPYVFSSLNLSNFFADLLSDYDEYAKMPIDYIKGKIATKACKAAVKAGYALTDFEIKTLFENMRNGVLLCPHGRPFVMKLSKLEVEKWFKRVL